MVKESACSLGDLDSIPGLGWSPREGNGYPLQYSCLENSIDKGSLVGYSPRDCKESDVTERPTLSQCSKTVSRSCYSKPSELGYFLPWIPVLRTTGYLAASLAYTHLMRTARQLPVLMTSNLQRVRYPLGAKLALDWEPWFWNILWAF